ncbi:nitrous oxide reductase family maturation protein NosD [Piscinibacter sp. HJYY11]|uniref:right-handed parallel beta-helix repeat-containing protein n=1 Tax=Piscinibacter sp. HJYY11 TaxID=2801333 RepID=UPI00191D8AEE|nr:NosD domain-containing protein [Piscinibacter sp. HJYY11]MBL0730926.1 hypothetical protein [Piscinibacter sp. HJYY11]
MMIRSAVALSAAIAFCQPASAQPARFEVPSAYPTIQSAINAATSGSTIVVAPGTYRENLVIDKALVLQSSAGPNATVIDGGALASVISARGTGQEAVTISGFRITNGASLFSNGGGSGGGIYLDSVQATVMNNIIERNVSCLGTGIGTTTAAVRIKGNKIRHNIQDPSCSGANGGGIFLNGGGASPSSITDNVISGHQVGGYGGGLAINAVNGITIASNVISDNRGADYGGGLFFNASSGTISSNVLTNNTATGWGGGMALLATDPADKIRVRENLLQGNQAGDGAAALLLSYYDKGIVFSGNVATGFRSSALVRCESQPLAVGKSNLLTNIGGPELSGTCLLGNE